MKISMAVPLVGFASTGGGPAAPITLSFTYTGAVQTWVAPLDVTTATVTLTGAGGGGGYWTGTNASGGAGGTLSGTLAITAGATYYIYCGGGGGGATSGSAGAGGFGGGGNGAVNLTSPLSYGAGGGGYTALAAGTLTGWVAIVGSGGGSAGANMTPGAPGGGTTGGTSGNPGYGGTQSAGGAAGSYGAAGDFMVGGNGSTNTGAGGGGSGLYGGGGGIGGGGGSTCVCSLTGTIVNTQGTGGAGGTGGSSPTAGANGTVTITYIGASQLVFLSTGADQTWIAPTGVTSITVTLKGANGGWDGNAGGSGGLVSGTLAVSAGSTYTLVVGSSGGQLVQTYYGGGGSPAWAGGGGGGRSAIRNVANTADLVTAGGAGGGSENSGGAVGGAGGGLTGGTGGGSGGGAGGGQAGGGSGVQYTGANSVGTANTAGGGGGWYGGANGSYSGGGGGGSSYVANLTGTVVNTQGANYAAGQIIIAYPNIITFLPTMLSGNILWLDAADTTAFTGGSTWTDKSGTGNNGINGTGGASSMPTTTTWSNGRQAARFVNASKNSVKTTNNIPSVNLTVFYVTRIQAAPGYGFFFINNSAGQRQLYMNTTSFPVTVYTFMNSSGGALTLASYNQSTPFLYSGTHDSSTYTYYSNGSLIGTGSVNAGEGTSQYYFGSANGDGSYLTIDVAEIIIYNKVMNTIERQQIEGYLAWKWGFQTSLPSGHPYANYQP
jgi:Glycine rich protein